MKTIFPLSILLLASELLAPHVCWAEDEQNSRYPTQLLRFTAAKEEQVRNLAKDLNIKVPTEISEFFKAAARRDYTVVTNTIARLAPEYVASYKKPSRDAPAWVPLWQPMTEVEGAFTAFAEGGTKYPLAFGDGIIESIPPGSIYFGGTDAGRSLVTALCKSHTQGKPFFTLTQNALSDGRYMNYLRAMYGKQIHLPTTTDVQKAIGDYKADALRRLKHDQEFPTRPRLLRPGEDVRVVNGEAQMNNQVSVMAIHDRLVKLILERNPKPEFYLEESFPLESIYPNLSPHGLIFKLNHEPVKALTSAMLDADHAFWTRECQPMLGNWLKPETSLSNVCHFAETIYGRKEWSDFGGDKTYVTNEFATKAFSKLRVSIAGLYNWRLKNKMEADDPRRLQAEADYAFRQAFAMCPTSLEVVFRYLDFLMAQGEVENSVILVSTAHMLAPDNQLLQTVLAQVRKQEGQTNK
jgi:hypothetical protein